MTPRRPRHLLCPSNPPLLQGTAAVLYCLTHGMLADCAAVGYGYAPIAISAIKTVLNSRSLDITTVPIGVVGLFAATAFWLFSSRTAVRWSSFVGFVGSSILRHPPALLVSPHTSRLAPRASRLNLILALSPRSTTRSIRPTTR